MKLKKYQVILTLLCMFAALTHIACSRDNRPKPPENLAKADKIFIYKVNGYDSPIFRDKQKFHGLPILSGPKELTGDTAHKIGDLLNQAFPFTAQDVPCIFEPTIGVAFHFKDRQIDVLVDFHCCAIRYFEGSKVLKTSTDCGEELISVLKKICPDDPEIQKLR